MHGIRSLLSTLCPKLRRASIIPIDPREQWALDEIRRRRASGSLPGTIAKMGPGHVSQPAR